MPYLVETIKSILRDVGLFAQHAGHVELRSYQLPVAQAVVESVLQRRGHTFVVMFPRQSGKNELQGHIESYLLMLTSTTGGEIVKASPTWRPQSLNAMRRLERILASNLLTKDRFRKREGYFYEVGELGESGASRCFFFSGEPSANVVGATAKTLLQCDEAQDVTPAKWDKDFSPMAASTNATQVFWGTAWTGRTLLARELRAARDAEKRDGIRRTFVLTADDVGAVVPAYKKFVAGQVAKLGRNHPLVRTQYYSEEIDAEGGMFPPARRALLEGKHAPQLAPVPGQLYALLIDVGGADEAATQEIGETTRSGRDSTSLTVVEIDLATVGDANITKPSYRIVARKGWTNVPHRNLYGQLRAQIDHWQPLYTVIDATGVGEGLASFLVNAMPPGRLIPFVFSSVTKSQLGWDLIALAETGRLKDHNDDADPDRAEFFRQLEFVMYEAREHNQLRWSVPDGTRDPATGDLVHDDWVLSAALASVIDSQPWGQAKSAVIDAYDPLEDSTGW
jgi:hypothetical protein